MNRLIHLLFPVALGLASGAAADLVASLDAGGNKWGYAAPHAATVQPWDGSPFTLEAELLRPAPGPSGLLPRESWFGLFIEDGPNGSRFSFGPFNPERDANPARVPLAAVCYEKRGHFQVKRSSEQWDAAAERLFLKAEYDGETLRFSASTDGQACREALRIVPAKPFMPNRIGLTLDGFHDRSAIRELRVKEFRVSGSGPARSDRFDGSRQAGWNSTEPKRARFLHPVELELEWRNPPSGNNVFDRGREAAFALELRTTQRIGETVGLRFRCFDRDGRELWNSSERRTLTAEPLRLSGSVPAERLARNGVYRLRAEAALPGKPAQIREQQFAVIPVIPVTPDRYDRRSPYSGNYFADWNLAARLGIRQIRQTWRQPGEFETRQYAERARANGLLVNGPCLDAAFRPQTPQTLAAKADRIAAAFLKLEKKYPDFIYCQEIYNEPENWPPTAVETDLVPFAALVARVRQNLRAAGSKLRLMSPGTTHVNLSFLKTLALVGGRDVVDIVAVHGYRSPNRPEFGHEEDIAAIRDLFGDKPVYVNEDAYFALTAEKPEGPTSITQPFHTMIELDELTHAIYLQRKYLCQFMAGYALVNQFDSIRNHSLSEHEFHRRPGLVTLAALAATLPHPEFVRRRTASTDHLWILDWTTDGRPVTTLWSLNDFHEVTLTAPEPLRVLDAFGNETANGRKVALTVGGAPLFVLGGPVAVEKRAVTARHPAIVLPEEEPLGGKAVRDGGVRPRRKSDEIGDFGHAAQQLRRALRGNGNAPLHERRARLLALHPGFTAGQAGARRNRHAGIHARQRRPGGAFRSLPPGRGQGIQRAVVDRGLPHRGRTLRPGRKRRAAPLPAAALPARHSLRRPDFDRRRPRRLERHSGVPAGRRRPQAQHRPRPFLDRCGGLPADLQIRVEPRRAAVRRRSPRRQA